MKKSVIKVLAIAVAVGFLIGCHDHDDIISPAVNTTAIEFDTTSMLIREDEGQQVLRISFDKPARKDGTVNVSLSGLTEERFVTDPPLTNGAITLTILKDQQTAMVMLVPINNTSADGDQDITLMLSNPSDGFCIGTRKTLSVKLMDDDAASATSIANFIPIDGRLNEQNPDGKTISIKLSETLKSEGVIEILVESQKAIYGTHFVTEPASINGRITLRPAIGEDVTRLTVIPINNSVITGEFEISLTLFNTSGSIKMGTQLSQRLTLADDELLNKPKGYDIAAGSWGLKRTYEYDEVGRIKHVNIESSSPATSNRTETYFYNASGRIESINTYPQIDMVFTWKGDRITKSETIDQGIVKSYTDFDYDNQGNVSGTANYYRQPDGQFKLGTLITYLYFTDGNLFKSLHYIPTQGSQEYTLLSTRTYEGYSTKENPFPMVEILPTVRTQNNLPGTYRVEENGVDLLYTFTYEFRNDGRVTKRIATSGALSETSTYHYY